jgi:SAM-dependent methyltransferase
MSADGRTWEEAVVWLKAQADQADLVRDCFFDDPPSHAAERYYESAEWEAVRKITGTDGGRALDVGAGLGISSYALARDHWEVTALEPDPSPIVGAAAIERLATNSNLPIAVVGDWGEALPFPDASFDLVYGRQVLHHARDLPTLCAEMARVLKPDGTFLATREHVIFKDDDLAVFLEQHPLHRLYGGENAYRLDEYKRAIESAGIRLTRILNPWASAINLHPRTTADIGRRIHARLPFIPASVFTPSLLGWVGWLLRSPGTNYSFLGVREAR